MTDVIVSGRMERIASTHDLKDACIAGLVGARLVGAVTHTFVAGGIVHSLAMQTAAGELVAVYWDRTAQQFATLPIDRSSFPALAAPAWQNAAVASDELAVRVGALELVTQRHEGLHRSAGARVDELMETLETVHEAMAKTNAVLDRLARLVPPSG